MKTLFIFITLLTSVISFGQTGRYQIKLDFDGAYEQIKTTVKNYGTYQLAAGTVNDNGTTRFWFAKMQGESLIWSKMVAAHPIWAPMDIAPTDIAQCGTNGDVLFVGRGNSGNDYTAKVIKLNAAGELIWSTEIKAEDASYSQTVYENNPVIVEEDGVIISLAGTNHLQITKLDLDGNLVYSKQLQVDGTLSTLNPGHLFVSNQTGGYFAGFECDNAPAIVSLDESLNVLWAKKITQGENASLRSIVQTQAGDLFLGGMGEGSGETFITKLNSSGIEQHYAAITNSELYSIDQLLELDDTTLIANGRTGYLLVNTNDWTYDELLNDSPFCSFDKSASGWSFGSHWNYDYYLDFDPRTPECFSYTGPVSKNSNPISAQDEAIVCSVVNMGSLLSYSPNFASAATQISSGCFLSVSDQAAVDLTIYPNPLRSGEMLSFSSDTDSEKNTHIQFTDLQGKVLAEIPFEKVVATPHLSSGVYFVKVLTTGNDLFTSKLVIE